MELGFWLIPLSMVFLDLFGTITGSKMLLSLSDSKKLGKQETSANSFISTQMWHHHLKLIFSFIWHILQSVTLLCHLLTALTDFSRVFCSKCRAGPLTFWAQYLKYWVLDIVPLLMLLQHDAGRSCTQQTFVTMYTATLASQRPLHLVTRRHSGNTAPAADGWDCNWYKIWCIYINTCYLSQTFNLSFYHHYLLVCVIVTNVVIVYFREVEEIFAF